MSDLDRAIQEALQGSEQLGVDQLGEDALHELAAELGVDPGVLGAVVRRTAARKSVPTGGAPNVAAIRSMVEAIMKEKDARYGILAPNLQPTGAFGMKGSMNLVTLAGDVPATGSLQISRTCDRDCVIREIWCTSASGPLKVTDFKAGAIPFVGFQFPISLERFTATSFHHEVRAIGAKTSQNFLITLSNASASAVSAHIELWGTAE